MILLLFITATFFLGALLSTSCLTSKANFITKVPSKYFRISICICIVFSIISFSRMLYVEYAPASNCEKVAYIFTNRENEPLYFDSGINKYFIVVENNWNMIEPTRREYFDNNTAETYIDSYNKLTQFS